ncbi:uncharacterized protein LOC132745938 isoform X2 [Ruditapes philippinarum]|uniref:uncharacterized protein LOC132745938 isoform X2 n=1 Tax=Ruditapes philippinarum TaxID=129788 RepID=UPI00295AD37D|nr:uncharacterized protein LOC132745938 isoform X2 [Ruditapes philippinarum]
MTCYEDQGWLFPPYCNSVSDPSDTTNVSVTFRVFSEEQQKYIKKTIKLTLEEYFGASMPGNMFDNVTIISIVFYNESTENTGRRKRQALSESTFAQVNYTVYIKNTTEARGEFAIAQANLTRRQILPICEKDLPITRTCLNGLTLVRPDNVKNDTLDFEGLQSISCQIFEYTINGCPEGTECHVHLEDDTTRCDPVEDRSGDTGDEYALKVGFGVGIPMFLLLCALLGCLCSLIGLERRRKRRKQKRLNITENSRPSSAASSGFTPAMIPIRFDTVGRRGPVYGSQFPDLWEGTESVVDLNHDQTPQSRRRRSFPNAVQIGHEDFATKTNF